jgi:hypothetical protein
MYLGQLGEASALDYMKIRNFPLSLTGTAFAWFTSLPPLRINCWAELEVKFHSHFYTGTQETRFSQLTSVKQMHDETVVEFFNRVREIKNKCFHLSILERDLVDICFNGLHSRIIEKLENVQFTSFNHLIDRAVFWSRALKSLVIHIRHIVRTHMLLVLIGMVWMMKIKNSWLLKLDGQQRIKWLHVHLSNRFIRIRVKR